MQKTQACLLGAHAKETRRSICLEMHVTIWDFVLVANREEFFNRPLWTALETRGGRSQAACLGPD